MYQDMFGRFEAVTAMGKPGKVLENAMRMSNPNSKIARLKTYAYRLSESKSQRFEGTLDAVNTKI